MAQHGTAVRTDAALSAMARQRLAEHAHLERQVRAKQKSHDVVFGDRAALKTEPVADVRKTSRSASRKAQPCPAVSACSPQRRGSPPRTACGRSPVTPASAGKSRGCVPPRGPQSSKAGPAAVPAAGPPRAAHQSCRESLALRLDGAADDTEGVSIPSRIMVVDDWYDASIVAGIGCETVFQADGETQVAEHVLQEGLSLSCIGCEPACDGSFVGAEAADNSADNAFDIAAPSAPQSPGIRGRASEPSSECATTVVTDPGQCHGQHCESHAANTDCSDAKSVTLDAAPADDGAQRLHVGCMTPGRSPGTARAELYNGWRCETAQDQGHSDGHAAWEADPRHLSMSPFSACSPSAAGPTPPPAADAEGLLASQRKALSRSCLAALELADGKPEFAQALIDPGDCGGRHCQVGPEATLTVERARHRARMKVAPVNLFGAPGSASSESPRTDGAIVPRLFLGATMAIMTAICLALACLQLLRIQAGAGGTVMLMVLAGASGATLMMASKAPAVSTVVCVAAGILAMLESNWRLRG